MPKEGLIFCLLMGSVLLTMVYAQYRYIYHSMFAFFDRDNVGLPGFAEYFRYGEALGPMHHACCT